MKKNHFIKLAMFFCMLCIGTILNAQTIVEDGSMWLMVERDAVGIGQDFAISVHINPLSQKVAAFSCTLTYDTSALQYVSTVSGPEGLAVMVVNPDNPGKVVISSFDVDGKGPGQDLNLVYFVFKALKYGVTTVKLETTTLSDPYLGALNVLTRNPTTDVKIVNANLTFGDVNNDGAVNIVDALNVARYGIGLITTLPNVQAGDVTGDLKLDIKDALLIAQDSCGLGLVFPIITQLKQIHAELIPVYPNEISPAMISPSNPNLSVKFRDTRGAPITDKWLTFSDGFLPGEMMAKTDAAGLATIAVPVEVMVGDFKTSITVKYGGGDYDAISLYMSVQLHGMSTSYPYNLDSTQVSLTLTSNASGKAMQASVMLPDSCELMSLWGNLRHEGNNFSTDTTSYQFIGNGGCLTVITYANHTYDLGQLQPGSYTFTFSNWGTVIKTITFNIPN